MLDNLIVFEDIVALVHAAAQRFISIGLAAIQSSDRFTVALSGGSTPHALYEILARDDQSFAWDKVHFFWGDERCVPPDHAESNFGLAHRVLLTKVNVLEQNVHRIHGEENPQQAAIGYEHELRKVFGEQLKPNEPQSRSVAARAMSSGGIDLFPRFDLILLGLGADGHTASLFPQTSAIHEQRRWVIANHVEQLHTDRITLTPPVINRAQQIIFLIAGSDKAPALRSVLQGQRDPNQYPAQIVKPVSNGLTWLVDRAAATFLA
ncbi:MAG TPA: 6-phosphogluconolactonase [Anaerolineae bacterium]|nr:6-phosphogluconolactonase [Anaerolineae bacterium]